MSLWSRIRHAARVLIGAEPVLKSLPPKTEKIVETYGVHDIGRHLSQLRREVVPGGRGPRKLVGFDYPTLRNFARTNPWLRAIIDIRKREVASCEWDIVPKIEAEEKELETLRQLIMSVNRFPDRQAQLDKYKAMILKRDMVAALIEATRKDDISPSEIRYRFQLALGDISRVAEQHAALVRPLFANPSRLDIGWADILTATIPDLLILDAMCIEKRRTKRPEKDGWPLSKNPIVELCPVDGATVRPILTIDGLLEGVDDGEDDNVLSYEQWIDGKRIDGGGWRYCDLMYLQENPQTDIDFRGYGYSRVESLAMSCVLDAHNDKSDLEEFKRQTYGGALVFKQLGIEQQDLDEKRIMFEEELEGTQKIPMFGMPDEKGSVEYVSFSGSPGQRDKKSEQRALKLLKRMCTTFEIPLTKVAEASQTNYATSKTTQEQSDDGLRKLLGFLDSAFTRNIVDEFGFSDIQYSSSPSHSRDEKAELEVAKQKAELGIWDINDIRMEYGQSPIEEGDISWYRWSEGQKAMGMGEGQNASAPPDMGGEGGEVGPDGQPVEGGQEGDPNDPEGDGEDLNGDGIDQSDQIEDTMKALGGDGHPHPEIHRNPYVEASMSDMANALISMWDDIMPQIQQAIANNTGMSWMDAMDQVMQRRHADIERITREHAQKMFGLGAVTAEMGEDAIVKPATLDNLQQWAKDNPGYVSSQAMQYLAASAYTEAKARQQSIMDDLKRRMILGIQQGFNPITVANDFAQSIGDNSYSDYQRLARTEMAKAFAVGALEQAKEYGIDYVYVPENPRACEHCQRLVVGRVFPREALEGASNYGRKVQDWIPALPVHPNCTDHAIPASSWAIQQAAQGGPIPPEGVRIQFVPPSQRGKQS